MKHLAYRIIGIMVMSLMPLFVSGTPAEKQEQLFYYSFDKKVPIEVVPGKFMVKKNPTLSKERFKDMVSSFLDKADYDWFNSDICTITTDEWKVDMAQKRLLIEEQIESVRNVYVLTEDKEYYRTRYYEKEPLALGMNNQISLKYKDDIQESERSHIIQLFDLREVARNEVYELYAVPKDIDILKISNELYETGLFLFVYPQLICRVTFWDELATYPNDPYFQYQVTLHNTGQNFNGHTGTTDADIDAPEAWALTMGSEDIVIAVIDEGVTSNHPDLPNTRQVRLNGSNFGLGDPNDPSPIGNNNHGNACAGVIAATTNNGEGIAGIAPLCKIMPIRIDNYCTPVELAAAIRFAVDNGANIISCSWGYPTRNSELCPDIINAINYAINQNSMILFSAGNTASHAYYNDGYVCFPANHKTDGMLAVGASDRYDHQADYSPTDSCIDIVAPSHRAYPDDSYSGIYGESFEMWTIDIPGNSGYNPWPADQGPYITTGVVLPNSGINYLSYTGLFGGTSHACPVVAGVAALVLSVNPNLNPQAICNVIKSTADKVGGYTYDINGRCNQMGFGRVNANNAVWMVCDTTFCTGQIINENVSNVTGCDVYLSDDYFLNNSLLRVRARNSVTIEKELYIDLGSELDIKKY